MYEYLTGIFILIICLIIYFTYYYILDKVEEKAKEEVIKDKKSLSKQQLYEKLKHYRDK